MGLKIVENLEELGWDDEDVVTQYINEAKDIVTFVNETRNAVLFMRAKEVSNGGVAEKNE